jgi:putative hemolysin
MTTTSFENVYRVLLTRDQTLVEAAQRLRHDVLTEALGTEFPRADPGLDRDYFDAFCEHLLIWHEASETVVGTCRMLRPEGAKEAGVRYSERMFDLSRHAAMQPDLLEVGRLCVDPAHRNGSVIAKLWSGVARHAEQSGCRWIGGSYSAPLIDGGALAAGAWDIVSGRHLAPERFGVRPLVPWSADLAGRPRHPVLPAPLRFYLRLGAWVCGEPAYDHALRTADMYVLLDLDRLDRRFLQHVEPVWAA